MAAEELTQATRRWRWWSGAASKTQARREVDLTRCARGCHERFACLPFWRVSAASHCVHSCSRSMFEKSRDESSYGFHMKKVCVHVGK
eukprot:4732932-Prymnesium_polylepis.1